MEAKIENLDLNSLGVTDDEAHQIGLRLKAKREQNQPSIDKIAHRLKINRAYIEIIESGDWHPLPQSANGRGFVRLYAKELDVPLPEFEKFLDAQKSITPEGKLNLDKIVACAREKGLVHMNSYQAALSQTGLAVKNLFSSKKKWLLLGSLGIVVAGAGTTVFSLLLSQHNSSSDVNSTEIGLNEESPATEMVQNAPIEAASAPTETVALPAETSNTPAETIDAPETVTNKPVEKTIVSTSTAQKMQVEILSPVSIHIETDGNQVIDGLTQPGILNLDFKNKALLIIEDSSKVKLSYAGWEHEILSASTRKRIIALHAQPFET